MKEIREAGFTMIQTSPVQRSYAPEGSGKKLFDEKVTGRKLVLLLSAYRLENGETPISAAATR